MARIENTTVQDSIANMKAYFRYVDDIVLVVPEHIETDTLLDKFNTAHPNLSFTIEQESSEGKLPFLDVALWRTPDEQIDRRIHRKATWNGNTFTWIASSH